MRAAANSLNETKYMTKIPKALIPSLVTSKKEEKDGENGYSVSAL